MLYNVTKLFIGGTLAGLSVTYKTTVRFTVGQTVAKPCGGSPYRVVAVQPVGE